MMVIGANTPAMIKAMTTEVESKKFILPPYIRMSALRCACYRLNQRSLSQYTVGGALFEPLHARRYDWQRS
jgi:hypothetical protein